MVTGDVYDTIILEGGFKTNPGLRLDIMIEEVRNQPSLKPKSGFFIITTDGEGNEIDKSAELTLTLDNPSPSPPLNSQVTLTGDASLGGTGTYEFYFQINMPIPTGGSIQVTLPPEITYSTISSVSYTGKLNLKPSL